MGYTKKTWKDYPSTDTLVTAFDLNHMEDGIYNADEKAQKALDDMPTVSDTYSATSSDAMSGKAVAEAVSGVQTGANEIEYDKATSTLKLKKDGTELDATTIDVGTDVSVTQIQASGVHIADVEVDGAKTEIYAPNSGGSTVSVTQIESTGTHIADIEVDGTKTEIYAPSEDIDIDTALSETSENPVQNKVVTSALNSKADIEDVINSNLLNNPWVSINQRGLDTYTAAGYTVDRWRMDKAGTLTVTTNGITIQNTLDSQLKFSQIIMTFDDFKSKGLFGKPLTLSINISGILYSVTGVIDTFDSNVYNSIDTDFGVLRFTTSVKSSKAYAEILLNSGVELNIRAFKLEVGSKSTLANDTAPDVEVERLKCSLSTADASDTYANRHVAEQSVVGGDAYNSSKAYTKGDLFIYNNVLYKVKDSVTSVVGKIPPNDTYYEATNIVNELNHEWIKKGEITGTNSLTLPSNYKNLFIIATTPNGHSFDWIIPKVYVDSLGSSTTYLNRAFAPTDNNCMGVRLVLSATQIKIDYVNSFRTRSESTTKLVVYYNL